MTGSPPFSVGRRGRGSLPRLNAPSPRATPRGDMPTDPHPEVREGVEGRRERFPRRAQVGSTPVRRWARGVLPCLVLAAVFTLLNCLKPLHIDDTAYYLYASHIARDPLSPYGFEILWKAEPCPANEVLAPPVLPYWWAAGITLFGDRPALAKLWLLPCVLVLVFSLHTLLGRLARR